MSSLIPVQPKKLIEVALPLEVINKAAAREKGNPFLKGHPRNLHQWWARRPLAAARAVVFAQMVDDPSARPDLFPTTEAQEHERQRLFRIIEDLVQWENSTNDRVLEAARDEIRKSWRHTCSLNRKHPRAAELFDPDRLPAFHDPFAGGGSLPLEALRLGLESYASDLNPVAVLINKAMIEIPPRFAGRPPVHPAGKGGQSRLKTERWHGAQGLAEDVRYYGQWMRDEAEKRIGHLYPKVDVTPTMAKDRPDLKPLIGQRLTVIAWLWARTVKSPNPAFAQVDVPLASTFMLSTKPGKEAYVDPVIENGGYRFAVRLGEPKDAERAKSGTKLSRGANFQCVMSGAPISGDYIKAEGQAGRMGARLMAIIGEDTRGRVYLPPTPEHESIAEHAEPAWRPDSPLPDDPRNFWTVQYGLTTFGDLFTPRQLVALTTYSDLVADARERVRRDAVAAGFPNDHKSLREGGDAALAYAEAVSTFESLVIDKLADYGNTICTWNPINQNVAHLFTKQVIPMAWDFAEASPIDTGLSFASLADGIARSVALLPAASFGSAVQHDSTQLPYPRDASISKGVAIADDVVTQERTRRRVLSTDPPYYDNISYADLSDFFYVWLRRSLRSIFPELFSTVAVPKAAELVATPYRHGSKDKAEAFFLNGMTEAVHRVVELTHEAFPITIYYAFKQSESDDKAGTVSTGWDTFLDAVIRAGLSISGTWPMRTERGARSIGIGTNALASSIVLVCRPRPTDSPRTTRREFILSLKTELPKALAHLQRSNIAPVDLAQAAIGPGMAVYTRYERVLDAAGQPLPVREALALINQTLDEILAEQEGDFDADTRWALAWFEQFGFNDGPFGEAETLSKAKNTAVQGLVDAGVAESKRGRVRLFRPEELSDGWDPETDPRVNVWEVVHHLARSLEKGGETAAAGLAKKLGTRAEVARELAYRLYTMSERKKRAQEALRYNALVQSWPEISRLAREQVSKPVQATLFEAKE